MSEHSYDLLSLALWLLGGAGGLILTLLGVIAAIARWNGRQVLLRMDKQDDTMEDIKVLLTSETKLLREGLHAQDTRIVRLEEFKMHVQNVLHFGRRAEDQNGGDN